MCVCVGGGVRGLEGGKAMGGEGGRRSISNLRWPVGHPQIILAGASLVCLFKPVVLFSHCYNRRG